jgi:hypothetical protein
MLSPVTGMPQPNNQCLYRISPSGNDGSPVSRSCPKRHWDLGKALSGEESAIVLKKIEQRANLRKVMGSARLAQEKEGEGKQEPTLRREAPIYHVRQIIGFANLCSQWGNNLGKIDCSEFYFILPNAAAFSFSLISVSLAFHREAIVKGLDSLMQA